MVKNLVIVESPAKAKTIGKFLGPDYTVMSSYGHIRDLAPNNLGVDTANGFQPEYVIPDDKRQLVRDLRKAASQASMVWLASDEDREGEAISWHLYEVLGLKPDKTRRIVFHEITKDAILHAIQHPREIDLNLVDAQQARRVLDRIVGFELSPVLWRKIRPALSAGRVQSVAVRLIVEREEEIKAFRPEPYFRVTGRFATSGGTLDGEYSRRLTDEAQATRLLDECAKASFAISDINVKPLRKSPAPPFTTSTLQQEASRKLGFSVSKTMMVAQHLYEAGHITYMRTDSLNLSTLALNSIAKVVGSTMGENYLKRRTYHTSSKGAQEAHEAIRPTYVDRQTIPGNSDEQRLYALIWKRTVASQMADAELEKTTVEIEAPGVDGHFTASGEVIKFDGFLRLYIEGTDDDNDMEELGIGRPSTYAPTISTIQQREYVEKGERPGEPRRFVVLDMAGGKISRTEKTENTGSDRGKLIPTDTGTIVNEFLTRYFPNVLDYNFTAKVEERFDKIAEGDAEWSREIGDFYDVFHPEVKQASDMRLEHRVGERLLGQDPASGRNVYVKIGRFGPVVQIGESTDEEKPQFASLRRDQSVLDITLPEALKLFELPRTLGTFEDTEVSVGLGRFGPYVKHAGKFVSIPRDMAPLDVTLDQAIALIEDKRQAETKKTVKEFAEDPDVKILNGRYGVYIHAAGNNYKIPKTVTEPERLTIEEVREIIAKQDAAPKRTSRRTSTRRK
ncbi:type I DNA topoisomerase [Paramuribaculum intestinale]|uniref:type I DNA topoisomerase n=1 Tax=Paramuribaculum intestinale TaxID=2094151 RepID=UPI0025A5B4EE|nr:type I DNA topoisomerase [Paramuribaculum intestinale]